MVTLSVLLCLFVSNVTAAHAFCLKEGPITITKGSFDFSTKNDSPEFTVRSAIVSLPEGESGNIDEIIITGPEGQREFGCFNIKGVKNGTNLISDCGGPAVLKAGKTVYKAKGSGFDPESNVTDFSIKLCDTFAGE